LNNNHAWRVAVLLATLLFTFSTVNLISAAEEDYSRIRLPYYELYATRETPGRVVVSFAYTKNVSVQVGTLKTSLYKATTSPVQVEFQASDIDLYTVTINVTYEVRVTQTIAIGIFEAGRPAKTIEVDVSSTGFILTCYVNVVEAPRYPTPEEIGEVMFGLWRGELATFERKQQDLVNKIGDTSIITGSLAAIAFGVAAVLVIAVFRIHSKVAELSEWGVRHETEHRGE